MPSLSSKLKALGVKVGAEDIKTESLPEKLTPTHFKALEKALGGSEVTTSQGTTLVVENLYPDGYQHGLELLRETPELSGLADWVGDDQLGSLSPDSFAFIDTETTGLSGGTGTYAFLIGLGRLVDNNFILKQLFLRDPIEEAAQLMELEQLLAPCDAIVTFNGKSFDIPLLRTRYKSHRWPNPFSDKIHVDLLHLSRKLWRDRLPSRTLGNLEVQILQTERTDEDIPGWAIPQIYFEYLTTGEASAIKRVLYHNAMDIVSLAALFNHTARILANPISADINNGIDYISLGKLYEGLGNSELARHLYRIGLDKQEHEEKNKPSSIQIDTMNRIARLYKRQSRYQDAIPLWEQATKAADIDACVELAKAYEHKLKNLPLAFEWTEIAISLLNDINSTGVSRKYRISILMPELEHRLSRLERKISRLK